MASLLFMKLEGVDGEEPIGESQEMIAIHGYSHSLTMPVAPSRPSVGKDAVFRRTYCQHGLFTVVKGFDVSSPKLFEACANGVVFPNAVVHVCSQDFNSTKKKSGPEPFLSIVLSDALMVDFSYGFENGWQVESIAFRYASIGWKTEWRNPEDGKVANLEPVGWDGLANVPEQPSVPKSVDWS